MHILIRFFSILVIFSFQLSAKDSLPKMTADSLPKDIPSLYSQFDSEKEPLEMKVLHEYKQKHITIKMISYVVGVFKGKKVLMGAYLAYPTDTKNKVPGIVQIHGGGQRAMAEYAYGVAQNGYAVLATNWGGRLMEHQEKGRPAEGKVGTDWSPLDATQKHNGWYANTKPDHLTYDDFDSPRNNNWYLINLANKRAITLLQQLENVDGGRIGVHGHSMGGKLSVMLAGTDKRVKVAVPSCGGTGSAPPAHKARKGNCARPQPLTENYKKYIDDAEHVKYITSPIMYKGPHNDFNGLLSNMAFNWPAIPKGTPVRYSISSHMNHRHAPESAHIDLLMFEHYLKGSYKLPKTPDIKVNLKGDEKGPIVTVVADNSQEVDRVEIYYSQDPNGQFRFYRSAKVEKRGGVYVASAPITSSNLGFFAMATVHYKFPKHLKIQGPYWEKNPADTYLISTNIEKYEIPEVQKVSPAVTDVTTRMIQASFEEDGKPDFYRYSNQRVDTRKVRDPKWRGPNGAKLSIDVLDPIATNLIFEFEFNSYSKYGHNLAAGLYYVNKKIQASETWQTHEIDLKDLKPLKHTRNGHPKDWQTLDHLAIVDVMYFHKEGKRSQINSNPKYGQGRKIRNLKWVGGEYPKTILMNGGGLELSPEEYEKQFSNQIDVSLELEAAVDGIQKAED